MTKSTRNLTVLVGAVAILALAFAAAFPVWAQDGTGENTVQLQADDTLGALADRYLLTGDNLRQFFNLNSDLVLVAGQTITFPEGVTVNTDTGDAGTGAGGVGAQATSTPTADAGAGGGAGAEATGTPDAGGGAGALVTSTPTAAGGAGAQVTATPTAAGGAGAQATSTPDAGTGAGQGGNTYVTQEGDILGQILFMMGFVADETAAGGQGAAGGAAQATDTPDAAGGVGAQATGTPTAGVEATGTPDAGAGTQATSTPGAGAGAETTGTPTADVTGTPAGGGLATATPAAGGGAGQQVTDAQLEEFVTLNNDLQFVQGQSVVLPEGVVVTGQEGTQTPGADVTSTPGAQATDTPDAGAQATATPSGGQQGATEQYTVQAGETLADIANRFGVTVEELLQLNPNLVPAGTVINVPSQQGTIPQTGQATATPGAQQGGQTGGQTGQPGGQAGQTGQQASGEGVQLNQPGFGFQVGLEHSAIGPGRGVYIVRPGESLSSIADRLGTTIDRIRELNPGLQGDLILAGQRLIVPAGENPGVWQIHTPGLDPFQTSTGENANQQGAGE